MLNNPIEFTTSHHVIVCTRVMYYVSICNDYLHNIYIYNFFLNRKNVFMKKNSTKKKIKLYTLFTIYTSHIVG